MTRQMPHEKRKEVRGGRKEQRKENKGKSNKQIP